MPKITAAVPKYSHHKASGQAVVNICGKDHYLGPWKSKASQIEYDRLITEWIVAGRPAVAQRTPANRTVKELILAFWEHAQAYYVKHGRATGSADNFKIPFRFLRKLYGHRPASEFGPLALKAVRAKMIEANHSRRYINDNIERIKQMFRWAASEELISSDVYISLRSVQGLPKGRGLARESEPVTAIDDAIVDATLPHLSPVVAAMVRFQRLTGARPGEVCLLRPADIDRSEDIWWFVPLEHKTEHHGRQRVITIGLRAQEIIRPFLDRDDEAFCFSPCDSEVQRRAKQHAARKTSLKQGHRPGTNRKEAPKRRPKERYTNDSYRRAIHRACDAAFPPPKEMPETEVKKWQSEHRWSPNQLRHSAATEIRKRFGLEAASVILGHSNPSVTLTYAERDLQQAAEIMREIG
jgi:integrase